MSLASAARPPAKRLKKLPAPQAVDPNLPVPWTSFPDLGPPLQITGPEPLPSSFNRPKLYLWSTQRPSSFIAIPVEPSSPALLALGDNIGSSQNDTIAEDDEEDSTIVDEAARLKGVFWPGMDIFDSATSDMKRRRNQKKDVSVLENLEHNSLVVEATEVIYYSLGDLKKARQITGKVESSSSPLSETLPPPPKRKPPTRKPLAERSVNTLNHQPVANVPSKVTGTKGTRSRSKTTKQRRNLAIYKDKTPRDGDAPVMPLLTADFQPLDSNREFDLFRPSTEPGLGSHYASTYVNQQRHSTLAPYQSMLPFGQSDFYGPAGYDLAAFLSQALHREPSCQETHAGTDFGQSHVAHSDPIIGHRAMNHETNNDDLGAYSPLEDGDSQHRTTLDFGDDLHPEEGVLFILSDKE